MDYTGFLLRLTKGVAIFLTFASELMRVCQGRSLNGSNQGDHFKSGEAKLTTALGIQVTSPLTPHLVDVKVVNKTGNVSSYSVATFTSPWSVPRAPQENEFPLPLIIASPAVAVCIVIFICVAYKWHAFQLDEQARKLTTKVSESVCTPSPSCVPCSPCRTKKPLLPGPPGRAYPGDEMHGGARRKSTHSLATSLPSLSKKRDSCWSALSADQEVLNHASPRRHSTFVL